MKPQKASPAPSPVPQGQGGTELRSWLDTGSSDTQSDHTPPRGRLGSACGLRLRALHGRRSQLEKGLGAHALRLQATRKTEALRERLRGERLAWGWSGLGS